MKAKSKADREAMATGLRLVQRIHWAVMDGHSLQLEAAIDEYTALAIKLNGGEKAGMCAPGGGWTRLDEMCRAGEGVPMWGQNGKFLIVCRGIGVWVEFFWHHFGSPHFQYRCNWPSEIIVQTNFFSHFMRNYFPGATVDQAALNILLAQVDRRA